MVEYLLREKPQYKNVAIPDSESDLWNLVRSLMNLREPHPVSEEFLKVQDEYLYSALNERGVVDIEDLEPTRCDGRLYLWQGDITRLKVGAIVNAANSAMLGCFSPCHGCIDNAIHTYAGIQLREECATLMERQGHAERTGEAKITSAYNLPSDHVIHTVGPIVGGRLTREHEILLMRCYSACIKIALENSIRSIAFCCISTGEFMFPQQRAAEIAISTVKSELKDDLKVIFNVFKQSDHDIYSGLLAEK